MIGKCPSLPICHQSNLSNSRERDFYAYYARLTSDEPVAPPTRPSNDDQMVRNIHDILASYYAVACKRFGDNVVMQAGLYYLVTGPKSPLKLFNSEFVDNLSDDQLAEIAGEEPTRKMKRKQLMKQLADLEAGKKVLR